MPDKRLVISASPHIRGTRTIRKMNLLVIAALLPATLFGLYQFGVNAAILIIASVLTAAVTEAAVCKLAKRPICIGDFHAVLVGLMLATMVPAGCPWWAVTVGSFMAVLIGKMPFGSLGGSPLSPAIVGLLVILISWPVQVQTFAQPASAPDIYQAADVAPAESPLQAITIDVSDGPEYNKMNLFTGMGKVGSTGATSSLLLLLGGLFLIFSGTVRWQTPVGFLLGLIASAVVSHVTEPSNPDPLFHLLTGLTMFGAFFLATETPVTPVTPRGMFLFGLLAGALTILFRMTGMGFGSTAYAIIIMSLATPLFDRLTPTPFGGRVRSNA